MKKQHITLTDADRETLTALLAKGTLAAKTFKRATALLELDRGQTLRAVAHTLAVTTVTVAEWRDGYREQGVDCLYDAPRSGRPPRIDGVQRAQITALACSDAPDGHARWSLRLLADHAVAAGVCAHIAYTTVREVLKKTTYSRICSGPGALEHWMPPFWPRWSRYWTPMPNPMTRPSQSSVLMNDPVF